jgi:hypothetical protein
LQTGGENPFRSYLFRAQVIRAPQHAMVPEAGNFSNLQNDTGPRLPHPSNLAHAVLATELVDPAAGINDLLLTGVEGMTSRADLDGQVLAERAASREFVAATARYVDFTVVGMDIGFHVVQTL